MKKKKVGNFRRSQEVENNTKKNTEERREEEKKEEIRPMIGALNKLTEEA